MVFRLAGIAARRARAAQAPAPAPDSFEDSHLVYGDAEIFAELDTTNTCSDPGGHVWLRGRCLHCEGRDA